MLFHRLNSKDGNIERAPRNHIAKLTHIKKLLLLPEIDSTALAAAGADKAICRREFSTEPVIGHDFRAGVQIAQSLKHLSYVLVVKPTVQFDRAIDTRGVLIGQVFLKRVVKIKCIELAPIKFKCIAEG